MFDEKFWLALSTLTFVALIIKFVWPKMAKSLDSASQKIVDEIAKAKEAREKAAELLIRAEKYHQESVEYSNKLLQDAKHEAQSLLNTAQEAIALETKKKTEAAFERVKMEEERAVREIKTDIALSAVKIFDEKSTKEISEQTHENLIDQAIQDFGKLVN